MTSKSPSPSVAKEQELWALVQPLLQAAPALGKDWAVWQGNMGQPDIVFYVPTQAAEMRVTWTVRSGAAEALVELQGASEARRWLEANLDRVHRLVHSLGGRRGIPKHARGEIQSIQ